MSSSFLHAKLILQAIHEKKVSNFLAEDDAHQLEIYALALSKLRDNVQMYTPIDIPFEAIRDGSEVFNELSITLVPISLREAGEQFGIKETILPLVEEGLVSASQAIRLYEQERKKNKKGFVQKENLPAEYDGNVVRFRRIVIELHEHLRIE